MPRRDLFLLLIFALGFNAVLAAFIREPGYLDDAYYFGGALRLVQGYGFSEPYLWNYLGHATALPQPSHLYWMPLTSIVAAASMALLGQSFAAARLPLLLMASLLPLVAYGVAWHTTRLRRHALGAGGLALFSGFYSIYWGTTDSFALYGLVGSLTLFAIGRSLEINDWRLGLLAGLGAGLAHLVRADGVLLLVVGGWLLAVRGWSLAPEGGRWQSSSSGEPRQGFSFDIRHPQGAFVILGYLLIMLPWLVRNLVLVGSPFGSGGMTTLWLVEYNDFFNDPSNLTPARYFAAGWQTILAGKWEAVVLNLQTILAVQGMIFLTPLIVIGLWRLRQHALYRPVLVYAGLLYGAMTFAFSFPGTRGGLLHSGVALMPFYVSACFVGLDAVVDWIAARRPHWQPEKAKRNFSGLAVGLAALLTLFIALPRVREWGGSETLFREIGAAVPGDAVVMSNNPPGFWIATGRPGLPLVNGNVPNLLATADRFSARYVLLDHNYPFGLAELYTRESGARLKLVGRWGEWKLFEVAP